MSETKENDIFVFEEFYKKLAIECSKNQEAKKIFKQLEESIRENERQRKIFNDLNDELRRLGVDI